MSRYSFESDYEDEDNDDEMNENMADDLFLKDQIISVQQENNDILKMEVDEKLLEIAVQVCQHSWFWSWKSYASKVKAIKRVYRQFKNLLQNEKF
jgi:hypothetical protein